MLNWNTFKPDPLGPKVREISGRDKERLFFLMAQMFRSGQTTESSLRTVARAFKAEKQEDIAGALTQIAQKVAQGKPMSQAIENERILFNDINRAAIMAGEASNDMHRAFTILRDLEEKSLSSNKNSMTEFLTPGAMLLMSIASILNTGMNVLPELAKVMEAQNKQLPLIADVVMRIALFVQDWWHVLLAVVAVVLVIFYTFVRTPNGRIWLDKFLVETPILGKFLSYSVYNNMLLYFPHLIASGVKPKQMIPIMETLATNLILRRRIDNFNQVITTGGQMAEAMEKAGFPDIAVTTVRVSEHYAASSNGVNDAMIEGMQHAHVIIERMLNDTHKSFVTVISVTLWILGGAVMMTEMISIIFSQG